MMNTNTIIWINLFLVLVFALTGVGIVKMVATEKCGDISRFRYTQYDYPARCEEYIRSIMK